MANKGQVGRQGGPPAIANWLRESGEEEMRLRSSYEDEVISVDDGFGTGITQNRRNLTDALNLLQLGAAVGHPGNFLTAVVTQLHSLPSVELPSTAVIPAANRDFQPDRLL